MKTLLTLIGCCISFAICSQTTTKHNLSSHDVGVLSPKKDTLFLLNDQIGHKIKEVWDEYKYPNPPHIIFVDQKLLAVKINNKNQPQSKKKNFAPKNQYAD